MKSKYFHIFLITLLASIISLISPVSLPNAQWTFSLFCLFIGIIASLIQREKKAYQFLGGILVGSVLFGGLTLIAEVLHMILFSPSGFTIRVLELLYGLSPLFIVSSIICFFGGLIGIVLKGFYTLYGKWTEYLLLFAGPLALMATSLFVFIQKIGGTVRYTVHGWPYEFAVHRMRDVIDGALINQWSLSAGTLFWRLIAGYLFYFTILFFIRYVAQIADTKYKKKTPHRTTAMFTGLMIFSIILTAAPAIRLQATTNQIRRAEICKEDHDCVIIGQHNALSCRIVVNTKYAQAIKVALSKIPETDGLSLSCLPSTKASCILGRCTAEIEEIPEIAWQRIRDAINTCRVQSVIQNHDLQITAKLKTGETLQGKESRIDEVFAVIQKAEKKCGPILTATE